MGVFEFKSPFLFIILTIFARAKRDVYARKQKIKKSQEIL